MEKVENITCLENAIGNHYSK